MQAEQSIDNASGRRNLPSPFTASLAAARKYLERQRAGHAEVDAEELIAVLSAGQLSDAGQIVVEPFLPPDRVSSSAIGVPRQAAAPLQTSAPADVAPLLAEEASLDQDLEQEDVGLLQLQGFEEDESTAFEPELEYTERLNSVGANREDRFTQSVSALTDAAPPVLAPGGVPRAEQIRGAIFRLARESERTQKVPAISHASNGEPERPHLATGDAAAVPPDAVSNDASTGVQSQHTPESRELSFQEVARQVWGEDEGDLAWPPVETFLDKSATAQTVRPDGASTVSALDASLSVPYPDTRSRTSAAGSPGGEQIGAQTIPADPAAAKQQDSQQAFAAYSPFPSAPSQAVEAGVFERGEAQEAVLNTEARNKTEAQNAAQAEVESTQAGQAAGSGNEEIVPAGLQMQSVVQSVAEGSALAHDAGNLLSALGLYSELLCFSGVLQERHRHYAEDLKLLASRSQVLITRLVQLADMTLEDRQSSLKTAAAEPILSLPLAAEAALARGIHPVQRKNGLQAEDSLTPQNQAPVEPAVQASRLAEGIAAASAPAISTAHPGTVSAGNVSATSPTPLDRVPAGREGVTPASLVEVLQRSGSLLSTIAHGALKVQFGPQAALPVTADLESLERILVNLVCNATAAIREGGAIRIGVRLLGANRLRPAGSGSFAGQTMVLTVDDSGCGMSETQIRKVMKASGRPTLDPDPAELSADVIAIGRKSSSADDHKSGAAVLGAALGKHVSEADDGRRHGLGMKIVCDLVAASGGELYIQSEPGKGTRIEIHWRTVDAGTPLAAGDGNGLPSLHLGPGVHGGTGAGATLNGPQDSAARQRFDTLGARRRLQGGPSLPAQLLTQMPALHTRRPNPAAAANGNEGAIAC